MNSNFHYPGPINRQAGISENVYITFQNDTSGVEQRGKGWFCLFYFSILLQYFITWRGREKRVFSDKPRWNNNKSEIRIDRNNNWSLIFLFCHHSLLYWLHDLRRWRVNSNLICMRTLHLSSSRICLYYN